MWPVESQSEIETACWGWEPVALVLGGRLLVLNQEADPSIVVAPEARSPIPDGVSIDGVRDEEKLFGIIEGKRPEVVGFREGVGWKA